MNEDADPVIAQNRRFWQAIAPHRPGAPVDFFRSGGSALDARERARIGEVTGRRVLHLACSVGDESLSFAALGAEVTAVDFAPAHLSTGRSKAAALDLDVRFVEGDMTRLDPALRDFDLVYLSWGALCWVPVLGPWLTMISDRLADSGRIVISEHHPLWEVLSVGGPDVLRVTGDYFGSGGGAGDPAKAPVVTRLLDGALPPRQSFVHGVGALITAVLGAGLRLESFEEFAAPDLFAGLGGAAGWLPAVYLLTARRA